MGRAAELQRVLAALDAPSPAVIVIEGEAGIGKTRLVSEVVRRAELARRRWLIGSCRPIREPFPMGPVIEALRGLGDELAGAGLSPVAGALRPLLPELAPWLPLSPDPLDDRVAEQHRVFRALVELLEAVGPAVLVLEDVHWSDSQTIEFLDYLVADPPPRLSTIVTFRSEDASPAMRAAIVRLPTSVVSAHVRLDPMDVDATAEMSRAILGADRVSLEFARYLRSRSAGIPFVIEEVLALLRERGTLVRVDGRWARKALDELRVPDGVRDPVLERVGRLTEDGRAVVEVASVLGSPVAPSVLTAMGEMLGIDPWRGLEGALASSILREYDVRIGFRNQLAVEAVCESLSRPRRTRLHSIAADVLSRADQVPYGLLAHHLKNTERVSEWITAAEHAADQAIALGHEEESARLLAELLRERRLDADRRISLAVKLGRTMFELVRPPDEVLEILEGALNGNPTPGIRGELAYWLGVAMEMTGGDSSRRRELYRMAVEDLEQLDLKVRAMLGLGVPTAPHVRLSEHLAWLDRALELLPQVDDRHFEVFVRGKVAMVLVAVGDPAWRALSERLLESVGELEPSRRSVAALKSVGEMACYAGHYAEADRLVGAAREGAELCESRRLDLRVRREVVLLDYLRGSWDGLADTVADLLDELADAPVARVNVDIVAGGLALARGDLGEAERRLALAAGCAESAGFFDATALAVASMARMAPAGANTSDVTARIDRILAALAEKEMWAPIVRVLPAAVELKVGEDRTEEARELLARASRELTGRDLPLAPAGLLHAEGILYAASGDHERAAACLLEAVELYDRLGCPYEAAQVRERATASLFAANDDRAEPVALAALACYRQLNADRDVARCAMFMRGNGLRVPTPHRGGRRGYGDALSPRELDVARLAARGLSNREIAEDLFLSPTTVSKHLAGAMRKLGVHKRSAVAACLADDAAVTSRH